MRNRRLLADILTGVMLCLMAPGPAFGDEAGEDKAVYDYKSWDCRIDGNKFTLTVKHRLTINDRRGDGYRGLSIWENDFTRIVGVAARVLDAGGREIYRRGKGDMERACGFGAVSLYNDACLYHTVLESSQYPYIIEYEYTLESTSLCFWPGASLQNYIPVKYVSYCLTVPSEFRFHHKLYEIEIEPEVNESGGEVRYLWLARDIPALEEIEHLPPGYNEGARIDFASDRFLLGSYGLDRCDWTGIGLWYNKLADDRYLAGGPTTPGGVSAEAARTLFAGVKEKTRYVSVNVGVSGWQPHAASRTLELGYGDCKDMSTLLISRLRQQGIEAYPCLVLTRDQGLTDVDFPGCNFNHLITMAIVEGDTLWLDCTSDNCPFGEVPWAVEDVDALVVTPAGGQIRRTAASSAEDNRILRTTRLHIQKDLRMSLDVELQTFGNYAKFLRDHLESKDQDETRRFVNSQFDGAEKTYRIKAYEIKNLEDLGEPVILTARAEGVRPLRKIGATLYCDPFILDEIDGFEETDLENREFPLYLYYPEFEQSRLTITWDSSLTADSVVVPGCDSVSYPFGEMRLDSWRSRDTIRVDFSKAYHVYQVDVDQFADFEVFRERNREIIHRYVKLMVRPSE